MKIDKSRKIKFKIFLASICTLIWFINTMYLFFFTKINFAVDITLIIASIKFMFESLEDIQIHLWKLEKSNQGN